MSDLFNYQFLLITLISVIIGVIVSSSIFLLYQRIRKTKYDFENQKIQLEQFRSVLENEMYKINERLTAESERWKDVNHLLIRNEYTEDKPIKLNKKVIINDFLKSNGITAKDLIIDKDLIFVLTPFHNKYLQDYLTIRNICSDVGFKCVRGDENYFSSDIFPEMLKLIVKANLVIANINGKNPNVLYELGICQALDKPVILIAKDSQNLPVDIKSKRFIVYNTIEELSTMLKDELIKLLKNQMTINENDSILKLIVLENWEANTQKKNIQWTDYKEIDLKGYLIESISCSLIIQSDYMRFGFKILDKSASILGQNWIPSSDNSMLLHIGKEINDNKINATFYKGDKHLKDVVALTDFQSDDIIQIKMSIDNKNFLKFFINDKEIYLTTINYDIRERLILLAWGDNNEYKLTASDIEIKLR